MNNGNGTFRAGVHYPTGGSNPTALVVTDFSGDGRPDVVATNQGSRNVSVLLGNGDGTLQGAVPYLSGQGATAGAFGIAAGDLNSDGRLDLAVANSSSAINVLFGNGDGTFVSGEAFGQPTRWMWRAATSTVTALSTSRLLARCCSAMAMARSSRP